MIGCTNPASNNSSGSGDPSLAQYVCTKNIATTPGTLKLLPPGTAGTPQTRGYAEYVPPGYSKMNKYPCIIFLHGDGELLQYTGVTIDYLTYSCLPGMVYNDTWDKKHRFIVLAPQFYDYADRSAVNVKNFIQYAKANYSIDETRIYLSAVSGGGVALGNYLNTYSGGEAAAVVPVSCYAPPTASKKWKGVPVWFLCGAADTTVGPANLVTHYNTLIAAGATVTPRITLYTGVGHDANSANKSYAPELNDNKFETTYNGVALVPYSNIYDWLLQYHR
jgi:predicted peptidase